MGAFSVMVAIAGAALLRGCGEIREGGVSPAGVDLPHALFAAVKDGRGQRLAGHVVDRTDFREGEGVAGWSLAGEAAVTTREDEGTRRVRWEIECAGAVDGSLARVHDYARLVGFDLAGARLKRVSVDDIIGGGGTYDPREFTGERFDSDDWLGLHLAAGGRSLTVFASIARTRRGAKLLGPMTASQMNQRELMEFVLWSPGEDRLKDRELVKMLLARGLTPEHCKVAPRPGIRTASGGARLTVPASFDPGAVDCMAGRFFGEDAILTETAPDGLVFEGVIAKLFMGQVLTERVAVKLDCQDLSDGRPKEVLTVRLFEVDTHDVSGTVLHFAREAGKVRSYMAPDEEALRITASDAPYAVHLIFENGIITRATVDGAELGR